MRMKTPVYFPFSLLGVVCSASGSGLTGQPSSADPEVSTHEALRWGTDSRSTLTLAASRG